MREVEPAHVIALDYIISDDGTSNTCAKLRLQLSDPASPLQGRTFDIELPPPNCGHAEFVVPKHRFLASVHRKWKVGDCCQVCALSLALCSVRQVCARAYWYPTAVHSGLQWVLSAYTPPHPVAVQSHYLCQLICRTACYHFYCFALLILCSLICIAGDA